MARTVVETSVTVITNSPSQDYPNPGDHNLPTYDMAPGFKQVTEGKGSWSVFYYYINFVQLAIIVSSFAAISSPSPPLQPSGSTQTM